MTGHRIEMELLDGRHIDLSGLTVSEIVGLLDLLRITPADVKATRHFIAGAAMTRTADKPRYWILNEQGEPVPAADVIEWATWFETFPDRQIAVDVIGPSEVSTVFIGLDQRFYNDGPPLIYETLVFGGPRDGDGRRYSYRAAAEDGHREICAELRGKPIE